MKIHMTQKRGVMGEGWTRRGRAKWFKRTNNWKKVTCKQCLKHKK